MKRGQSRSVWVLALLVNSCLFCLVRGHGRMLQPPGRSTMWRKGFNTPANYNDNELNCGGYSTQWFRNKGKCGVCGDRWDIQHENEAGGKYATNEITQTFNAGSNITVVIEITADHKGYFVFNICPLSNEDDVVTESCLEQYPLPRADGERYAHDVDGDSAYIVELALPAGLTCRRCVLRWYYRAGNRWGCERGSCGPGKGPQEEFYACADVAINDGVDSTTLPPLPTYPNNAAQRSSTRITTPTPTAAPRPSTRASTRPPPSPSTAVVTTTRASTTMATPTSTKIPPTTVVNSGQGRGWWRDPRRERGRGGSKQTNGKDGAELPKPHPSKPSADITCTSAGQFARIPEIDIWCIKNCALNFCPPSHCMCTSGREIALLKSSTRVCLAMAPWNGDSYMDRWCVDNCPEGLCPDRWCRCY
ncbi:hypothetical protein ScPMuIL_017638 [Solemya velum]